MLNQMVRNIWGQFLIGKIDIQSLNDLKSALQQPNLNRFFFNSSDNFQN